MSAKENLVNTFGTLMTVVIAIICVGFFPFKIINSESHTVIAEIGNLRFIGPAFILIGIIGYLRVAGTLFLTQKVSRRWKECKNI